MVFDKLNNLSIKKLKFYFLLALSLFGIYMSQSTASIICLSVYFLLFFDKKIIIFIILLSAFILLNQNVLHKLPFFAGDELYSNSFNDRVSSLMNAIELYKENPLFGSGVNTYPYYYSTDSSIAIVNNIYFETLCEFGIIGFVIFFLFLYLLIFYNFRYKIQLLLTLFPLLIYLNAFPTIWIPFIFISVVILKKIIIYKHDQKYIY